MLNKFFGGEYSYYPRYRLGDVAQQLGREQLARLYHTLAGQCLCVCFGSENHVVSSLRKWR